MSITLIKATIEDCRKLYEMQVAGFNPLLEKYKDYETNPAAETIERVEKRLIHSSADHYFILLEDMHIGYMRIWRKSDGTTCKLSPISILPEFQGNGYAQEAIKIAEELYPQVKRWELETIKQESKLCHLYEKMGYSLTGQEENIKPGMDLVFYTKP